MYPRFSSAVPGSPIPRRARDGAAPDCATRFSLARGATDATPCKASVGGGVGGPRAVRGSSGPATGVATPSSLPGAPRDLPRPPLHPRDARQPTQNLSPALAEHSGVALDTAGGHGNSGDARDRVHPIGALA